MEEFKDTGTNPIDHDDATAATVGEAVMPADDSQVRHPQTKTLTTEQAEEIISRLKVREPLRFNDLKPDFVQGLYAEFDSSGWASKNLVDFASALQGMKDETEYYNTQIFGNIGVVALVGAQTISDMLQDTEKKQSAIIGLIEEFFLMTNKKE